MNALTPSATPMSWQRVEFEWRRPVTAALIAIPIAAALLGSYVQVLESAMARSPEMQRPHADACGVSPGRDAADAGALALACATLAGPITR